MRLRGGSTVLSVGLTDTSWLKLLASLLQLVFLITGGGINFNTPAAYLPSYSAKRQLAFTTNLAFLASCHKADLAPTRLSGGSPPCIKTFLFAQTAGVLSLPVLLVILGVHDK